MPFWTKTRDGHKEQYIRWGCRSPKEKGQFSGCLGHFKALAIFAAAVATAVLQRSLQKGIIQSVNNVMQQTGSFGMPGKCK